jgi:uncharacterized protein
MGKEIKTAPQHVKEIKGNLVTGIFSVFGNKDSYGDIIYPGAFAKTFAERKNKILHLWQHEFYAPPIAVIVDLQELTRDQLPEKMLSENPDATGAALVTRQYLDTPRGNEVLTAIKAGSPLEMSFGFDAMKYDFQEDAINPNKQIRNLREIRLWETSDVLWGANNATVASKALFAAILERRGLTPKEVESVKGIFDQLDTVLGNDDFTHDLKAGRVLSSKNQNSLLSAIEQIQAVLDDAAVEEPKGIQHGEIKDPPANLEPPKTLELDDVDLLESVKSLGNLATEMQFVRELRGISETILGA